MDAVLDRVGFRTASCKSIEMTCGTEVVFELKNIQDLWLKICTVLPESAYFQWEGEERSRRVDPLPFQQLCDIFPGMKKVDLYGTSRQDIKYTVVARCDATDENWEAVLAVPWALQALDRNPFSALKTVYLHLLLRPRFAVHSVKAKAALHIDDVIPYELKYFMTGAARTPDQLPVEIGNTEVELRQGIRLWDWDLGDQGCLILSRLAEICAGLIDFARRNRTSTPQPASKKRLLKEPRVLLKLKLDYVVSTPTKPTNTTFVGRMLHLLPNIAGFLNLDAVDSLAQTSKTVRQALASEPTIRVRKMLERHFTDAGTAAARLRETNSIVGGSSVLSVLCPPNGKWLPGDLDLIVESQGRVRLEQFLRSEGYVFDKNPTKDGEDYEDFNIVFRCLHYRHPLRKTKIDLCCVANPKTPADLIMSYHSTVVMNFYDGRALWSIFPKLTFTRLLLPNRFTPTRRVEHGLQKYVDRGWRYLRPEHELPEEQRYWIQDYIEANGRQPTDAEEVEFRGEGAFSIDEIPDRAWRMPIEL